MLDMKRIGEFIARLRKDKELTQSALADILCVTHQAVSKWENGQALPDIEVLVAMKKLFGVSVDNILDAECSSSPNQTDYCKPDCSNKSADEDNIYVDDYREFSSSICADKCVISGEARFMGDLQCDDLEVTGKCTLAGSASLDSMVIKGCITVGCQVQADDINIKGMLTVGCNIVCDSLNNCGRSSCGAEITCDTFRNTGMLNIGGAVTTDTFYNSGMLELGCELTSDTIENFGMLTIGSDVTTDTITNSGLVTIKGSLTADNAELGGAFNILGNVIVDSIHVILNDAECKAGSIKADSLIVTNRMGKAGNYLTIKSLKVEHAQLENVKADYVKMDRGVVGEGCVIGHLECEDGIIINPSAKIGVINN